MSVLAPRDAVYALARTQLDWIPAPKPTLGSPDGFAHEQRFVSCPDCLANGRPMFGCETCRGRGEIPDHGRDPYENRNQSFFADDNQRRRDRARMVDAQIIRLKQLARARDNDPDALPEDWLSRAVRLKAQQWARGDYHLLEQAQDLLAMQLPMRHLGWTTFVVEAQPLSIASEAKLRLDDVADWLADRMLSAIARTITTHQETMALLGGRARSRPDHILVPLEHLQAAADAAAGKGRWANGHTQGQRNALVIGLAAEGKTAGEIARRVGLTKRRVEQLLAEVHVAATGPAA
jgi:hypothetical protein